MGFVCSATFVYILTSMVDLQDTDSSSHKMPLSSVQEGLVSTAFLYFNCCSLHVCGESCTSLSSSLIQESNRLKPSLRRCRRAQRLRRTRIIWPLAFCPVETWMWKHVETAEISDTQWLDLKIFETRLNMLLIWENVQDVIWCDNLLWQSLGYRAEFAQLKNRRLDLFWDVITEELCPHLTLGCLDRASVSKHHRHWRPNTDQIQSLKYQVLGGKWGDRGWGASKIPENTVKQPHIQLGAAKPVMGFLQQFCMQFVWVKFALNTMILNKVKSDVLRL